MFASDLIENLEALIELHGDCVVTLCASDKEVGEIRCFDRNGNIDGQVVEFSLAEST